MKAKRAIIIKKDDSIDELRPCMRAPQQGKKDYPKDSEE